MLISGNSKVRNVLFLVEASQDIDNLIKLVTGEAGPVAGFKSNCLASIGLYLLAKKYNIVGSHFFWIKDLVIKYVEEDPFECLAVACECSPCDLWLANMAIKGIRHLPVNVYDERGVSSKDPLPFRHLHSDDRSKIFSNERLAHLAGTYSRANPAYFSPDYIARLGVRQYVSFVNAWHMTLQSTGHREMSEPALERLASAFEMRWKKWHD
jgi:hypothetical protein